MTHLRYFDSQVFQPEAELSRAEAVQRGHYLACYYTEGEDQTQPERAEVMRHTETGVNIRRVIYYNRALPHTQVIYQHMARYPGLPFDIVLPLTTTDDETVRTDYHYAPTGHLRYTTTTRWNARHFLEIRRDPQGHLIGSLESEYDEAGNHLVSRERNADGTIISEEFL